MSNFVLETREDAGADLGADRADLGDDFSAAQTAQSFFDSISITDWRGFSQPQTKEKPLAARPGDVAPERTTEFADGELAAFLRTAIDRFGSNGRLTQEQLKTAMCSPGLSIPETSALFTLDWWAKANSVRGNITREHFNTMCTALERKVAGQPMTADQTSTAEGLNVMNWAYRRDLNEVNSKVYANEADPLKSIVPEACVQPIGVGNCHFVAAMASLAALNPARIKEMITDNKNGTFTVTFPGQKPVTVNAPTRGEMLYYEMPSKNGTWTAVLMKAFGKFSSPGAARDMEGAGGSIAAYGLKILGGHGVDIDQNFLTTYGTMHSKLEANLKNHRPMIAGINNEFWSLFGLSDNKEDSSGLQCGHAYSVLDFSPNPADPQNAMITLRNPYGESSWFDGKPPDCITDLGGGKFQMSLYDFSRLFSDIAYAKK